MKAAAAILGVVALAFFVGRASAAEYSEDAVKAAYLYRFAGYIDWPQRGSAAPFTIDVLGAPGIAHELRRLLPGHPIRGQVAEVHEVTDSRDVGNAQILYVAAGHADMMRLFLSRARGAAMLVVTDEEGGLNSGSTLNFLTVDRNVRFEVSLTAAQRFGLKISSELLGVAIRVQGRAGQSFLGCGPPFDIDPIHILCAPRIARQPRRMALANPVPNG
jgi:hypothetical protein